MMKIKSLQVGLPIFFVLTFFSPYALSGEWYLVTGNQSSLGFVDKQSVKVSGSTKTIWAWWVFKNPMDFSGKQVDNFKEQLKIDCVAQTYTQLSRVLQMGNDVKAVDNTKMNPQAIVPDSIIAELASSVCKNKYKTTPQATVDVVYARDFISKNMK